MPRNSQRVSRRGRTCTSFSHEEEDKKHGRHLDHQILSEYLVEYKSQPRALKETLAFPQFIHLEEGRRPYSKGEIKGNRFILSTFDGTSAAKAQARRLTKFFLLHPVVDREAMETKGRHLEMRNIFSSLDDTFLMSMPQLKQRLLLAAEEE